MRKYAILFICLIIFAGCPTTKTPTTIVLENFNSYLPGEVPVGGSFTMGGDSTYTTDPKIIVHTILSGADGGYLILMDDALRPGTNGDTYTGYTYLQYNYTPPADGTLKFDYYHRGGSISTTPNYSLLFWKNFTGDISTEPPAGNDWSNNSYTNVPFLTSSVALSKDVSYLLTWRASKTVAVGYEDFIYIDNITFTY